MLTCRSQNCHSILTTLYIEGQGWIQVCPVCGESECLNFQKTPADADRKAGRAYVNAKNMCYSIAEKLFLQSFHDSSDTELKTGYLWWAVKCCFGVEYVRETLCGEDPQNRTYQYTPIIARIPFNASANENCETLREFEAYCERHPHEGLVSLYNGMKALYVRTNEALKDQRWHNDVFIAWRGSVECNDFAERLQSWLYSRKRFSFVSSSDLDGMNIEYFDSPIYAAMAKARVFVIVIDDYDKLGDGFLRWEILRMKAWMAQDPRIRVVFCGMKEHRGNIPAELWPGLQRHFEDCENERYCTMAVGEQILRAYEESIEPQRMNTVAVTEEEEARPKKKKYVGWIAVILIAAACWRFGAVILDDESTDAADLMIVSENAVSTPAVSSNQGMTVQELFGQSKGQSEGQTKERVLPDKEQDVREEIPKGYRLLNTSALECQIIHDGLRSAIEISGTKEPLSGKIAFPSGSTEIQAWSFYNHKNITGVFMPKGVEKIGSHAFYKCTGLKELILPSGLKYIGDYAFCDCKNLTSVEIPESVEHIGTWAFAHCYNLKTIIGRGVVAEELAKELGIELQMPGF